MVGLKSQFSAMFAEFRHLFSQKKHQPVSHLAGFGGDRALHCSLTAPFGRALEYMGK
jgi:hypothetical protein